MAFCCCFRVMWVMREEKEIPCTKPLEMFTERNTRNEKYQREKIGC
jgi:hypothetical protein